MQASLRRIVEEVTVATFRNIAENDGYDLRIVLSGMKIVLSALNHG